MKLARIRKSLVAAAAAAAIATGSSLAESGEPARAAGYAVAAALIAGFSTWRVRNRLGAAELRRLADEAADSGRP